MRHRVLASLAVVSIATVAMLPESSQAANPPGQIKLTKSMRVADAINALGVNADAVARGKGGSIEEWKTAARDSSAWVDRDGARFYVDPVHADASANAPVVEAAPFDYAQTFLLHSNPSATRKVFIDFDGHSLSGTAWGGGVAMTAEPYTMDVDPAFSAAELDQIQAVWQRMSEDYAPFNVDVTTEDPGYAGINRASSTDANFGTRVVVTGTTAIYNTVCVNGCGGVAYVGTIDQTGTNHDYYQPAWVFVNGVGSGAKNITEAASHEAGHNIGLSHDGTASLGYYSGHGAWAPIMGVGYSEPISQWSRGEYSGANQFQDDFVIAGQNQIPLRADDHGNAAAPTTLTSAVATAGVIHAASDVDAFQFATTGGVVTIAANVAEVGANLDIKLDLLDSSGAVVATSNPNSAQVSTSVASGLSASISTTLAAGTYRAVVDGTGFADPLTTGYSDYGSVGAYTVLATFSSTPNTPPTAMASATPTSGNAPLLVTFSSLGSTDSDGTIASYAWAFGDGTTSTAANPTKTYNGGGTFNAVLTVTDNFGATATSSVQIVVNARPTAVATATPTTGTVPFTVNYSGVTSTDSDGTIASYSWTFTDGTTSTVVNPSKTYTAAGTYSATLTVTDNQGAVSAPVTVTVTANNPVVVQTLRVQTMTITIATVSGRREARTVVRVTNQNGANVSGVTVSGTYSGVVTANRSGTTSTAGTVTLISPRTRAGSGTFTFTIGSLARSGYTYTPASNLVSTVSISF